MMEMTLTLLTRTLRDSVGALRAAEFVEAFESALASSSAMTVDVSELPCAQGGLMFEDQLVAIRTGMAAPHQQLVALASMRRSACSDLKVESRADRR